MIKNIVITAVITALIFACESKKETSSNSLTIQNPTDSRRIETFRIAQGLFPDDVSDLGVGMGMIGTTSVELLDENGDDAADAALVSVNLGPNESTQLDFGQWKPNPDAVKKTQAEISKAVGGAWEGREYLNETGFENVNFLRVPESHTDHSWFIRYEGPGWENELIGYRFYLDWRNAADIFGKKVDTLVLQTVGQDGFDSYHEEEGWGMDILKAGKSLGIGSIGRVNDEGVVEHFENTDSVTCEITRNCYLSSSIETNYYGWETSIGTCDLKSQLTINSGDRATIHTINFDKEVANFCTGIVKHPEGEFFQASSEGWGYIATYGKQTLFDDNLGMAIFYKSDQLMKVDTTDEHNHLVVFSPSENLEYQFLGAWEKEPNGIKTRQEFEAYLNAKLQALNNPLLIK